MTIYYGKNYHDPHFYSKKKMKVHKDIHVGFAFILVFKCHGGTHYLQINSIAVR